MAKKNSSILWTVYQSGGNNTADVIGNQGRITAQDNIGLGDGFIKATETHKYVTNVSRDSNSGKLLVNVAQPTLSDLQGLGSGDKNKSIVTNNDGNIVAVALSAEQIDQTSTQTDVNFVSGVTEDGNGKIHVTTKKITTATANTAGITTLKSDIFYENTKDKSTNVSVTPAGVWDAIESLDVSGITGFGAGKTLASLTETDGKIAATFQDIAVGGSAITLGTASVAVVTDSSKHLSTENLSVPSPSASGNTNAFIDTISQSATGKISVTKKTLSVATSSNVGGVKSTTTGTTANRDYSVEVNSDGTMKVNVPWENNTHYDSKTVICKTNNGTANTAVTSSETVYLNHVENGTVQSYHKILGTNCNITADSNGHLTIAPVITAPGNAKLKFQFGSATAVETGFTANASIDATYTFPTAATSAYGVTKLMTYGSSTPSSWNTFQTTDDSAVTSKYVYNYATSNLFSRNEVSNPTWNTALNTEGFWKVTNSSNTNSPGTGTWFTLTGDASTYKAQMAFGDSVQYRTYSNSSWSSWSTLSAITYALSGGNAATFAPVCQMSVYPNTGKVMAYTDAAMSNSTDLGYLVPKTNIGSVINPVYVDNGEVKACYQLTPEYVTPEFVGITLTSDSAQQKLFINSKDYSRYYRYYATVPASDSDPAILDHFTTPQVGGFLFGDGFGSVEGRGRTQGAPDNYWGVGGDVAEAIPSYQNQPPAVIEAPSVLYAMTTLIENSSSECNKELWNKHRIYNYDTCSMCRNVVRHGAGSTTSYITTKAIDNDHPACTAIAFIPPLHWAFVSGVIDVDYSGVTDAITETRVRFQFDLKSTETYTNGIGDDTVHALDVTLVPNRTSISDIYNFSFFAYNPDNSHGRYINCSCSYHPPGMTYTIRKQIMIVKTPENGSFDYVYDNYPLGWKPSPT